MLKFSSSSHESSNFEKFVKMFKTSCLLTILTNQNAHEYDGIPIGQLTGNHLKELLQNFEELIRGTAKLEQMNWSNIATKTPETETTTGIDPDKISEEIFQPI